MDGINGHRDQKTLEVKRNASPASTSDEALARFSQLRVLVIDDNYFARALLRNVLQALGVWKVAACSSAKDGIVHLSEEAFDLVLVDNFMPKVSGTAFTRTVRRSDIVKDQMVKIIMVSAYTDVRRIKDAVDAGIHDFLAKPYSAASVAQRLCASLDDERPFIREHHYIGPCRRSTVRKHKTYPNDRRAKEEVAVEGEIEVE